MELSLISVITVQQMLVCLARVAAILTSMPVFGTNMVPARAKVALAIMLTILVHPVVNIDVTGVGFSTLSMGMLMAKEVILGGMLGFVARLIFTAVEFGGTVVGYQMGFAAANVYDPQNQRQVSLMSQFQNVFAILVFLAIDGHHIFLRTLVASYDLLPPGMLDLSGPAVPFIVELMGHMMVLAVRFSAPVLAVLLLSGLILGIMTRVFPQLNVFLLSFPINIGLALIITGLTMAVVVSLLQGEFAALPERFWLLFEGLRG
ncbi:MAG: flagellar biosynthetic protein FliR [Geobacteraceae bacterium]|nr:flagellar biosynthetic protein FliR [Geobacteraceae bacterium]